MIRLPEAGLLWLEGEVDEGPCDDVSAEKWIRKPSGPIELFVYPDGPSGSGRYWTVTVGIAQKQASKPDQGVCLSTSTAGWPILRLFKDAPLTWLDDLDADGKSEVIIWASFFLSDAERQWESGLVAWVYQVDPTGTLALDWSLSRRMAGDLAAAYRYSPSGADRVLLKTWGTERQAAAQALEAFASKRCTTAAEGAR